MPGATQEDATPLSAAQLRALAGVTARQLSWGRGRSAREIGHWRRRAEEIPDPRLREDALRALTARRGSAIGTALFSNLPHRRSDALVRALVTFQALGDYLAALSARRGGRQSAPRLHRALTDALDPGRPPTDYYADHARGDDGGYLAAMVARCQAACATLPSYEAVRPSVVEEAVRAGGVLAISHEPDPSRRARELSRWADEEFPARKGLPGFELAAAASGRLMILGLLALAAEPDSGRRDIARAYRAYWPLLPLTLTMLDAFVDSGEGTRGGTHDYLAPYGDLDTAVERLAELIGEALRAVLAMPNGHRHAALASGMVAFLLSEDSAAAPAMRRHRQRLLRAGGSLTRLLAPPLRGYRVAVARTAA